MKLYRPRIDNKMKWLSGASVIYVCIPGLTGHLPARVEVGMAGVGSGVLLSIAVVPGVFSAEGGGRTGGKPAVFGRVLERKFMSYSHVKSWVNLLN